MDLKVCQGTKKTLKITTTKKTKSQFLKANHVGFSFDFVVYLQAIQTKSLPNGGET